MSIFAAISWEWGGVGWGGGVHLFSVLGFLEVLSDSFLKVYLHSFVNKIMLKIFLENKHRKLVLLKLRKK